MSRVAAFLPALALLGLPTPAHAATVNPCYASAKNVAILVCVDTEARTLVATDVATGIVLVSGRTVTSRYDTDCPEPRTAYVDCGGSDDSITPTGHYLSTCMDPLTGDGADECKFPNSKGLHWLIQWLGNFAIHGYKRSGLRPWSDSHGCIRISQANAETLFADVLAADEGGLETEVVVYRGVKP